MSPALQIVLAGVGTYVIRLSFVGFAGRFASPSPRVESTLRLIAPAVLAAIVADRLFLVDGELGVRWEWWIAGLIAGLVAWRWRSAGLTMFSGMAIVWALAAV